MVEMEEERLRMREHVMNEVIIMGQFSLYDLATSRRLTNFSGKKYFSSGLYRLTLIKTDWCP